MGEKDYTEVQEVINKINAPLIDAINKQGIRLEELTQTIKRLEDSFNGILQLAQGMSPTSQ